MNTCSNCGATPERHFYRKMQLCNACKVFLRKRGFARPPEYNRIPAGMQAKKGEYVRMRIKLLLDCDLSPKQIATRLGCGRGNIYRHINLLIASGELPHRPKQARINP